MTSRIRLREEFKEIQKQLLRNIRKETKISLNKNKLQSINIYLYTHAYQDTEEVTANRENSFAFNERASREISPLLAKHINLSPFNSYTGFGTHATPKATVSSHRARRLGVSQSARCRNLSNTSGATPPCLLFHPLFPPPFLASLRRAISRSTRVGGDGGGAFLLSHACERHRRVFYRAPYVRASHPIYIPVTPPLLLPPPPRLIQPPERLVHQIFSREEWREPHVSRARDRRDRSV